MTEAMGRLRTERVNYKGWRDSWRITNGQFELVIVPLVGGRLMRYAPVGGKNALWENPAASGKTPNLSEWGNAGGEKAWIWPQSDWPGHIGHDWPPPTALDPAAYDAEPAGPGALRLTSTVAVGFGVRAQRTIALDSSGSGVTITSTLEKVRSSDTYPMAAWSILQIPAPNRVWARIDPRTRLTDGFRVLTDPPKSAESRAPLGNAARNPLVAFTRNPARSSKVGIDADALAAAIGNQILLVRSVEQATGTYAAGERAQSYAHPDDDFFRSVGAPTYTELEFTSTMSSPPKGGRVTLVTRLSLTEFAGDEEAAIRRVLTDG